jgi:hypothetical protein
MTSPAGTCVDLKALMVLLIRPDIRIYNPDAILRRGSQVGINGCLEDSRMIAGSFPYTG